MPRVLEAVSLESRICLHDQPADEAMLNARTLFAVFLLLLAAGCATPPQSPEEMIAESAWDDWADNFNFAVEARRAAARSSPTPTARAVPTPRRER